MPPKFAGSACYNRVVVGFNSLANAPEVAVGAGFDDLEIVRNKAIFPILMFADRPNHPDLVRSAPNRFFQVGVGDKNRVDIGIAVDLDRRKPHWQRHTRDQEILAHLGWMQYFEFVARE